MGVLSFFFGNLRSYAQTCCTSFCPPFILDYDLRNETRMLFCPLSAQQAPSIPSSQRVEVSVLPISPGASLECDADGWSPCKHVAVANFSGWTPQNGATAFLSVFLKKTTPRAVPSKKTDPYLNLGSMQSILIFRFT